MMEHLTLAITWDLKGVIITLCAEFLLKLLKFVAEGLPVSEVISFHIMNFSQEFNM